MEFRGLTSELFSNPVTPVAATRTCNAPNRHGPMLVVLSVRLHYHGPYDTHGLRAGFYQPRMPLSLLPPQCQGEPQLRLRGSLSELPEPFLLPGSTVMSFPSPAYFSLLASLPLCSDCCCESPIGHTDVQTSTPASLGDLRGWVE